MNISALRRYDWLLIGLVTILVAVGFSFVYSASLSLGLQRDLLLRQGIAALFGLVLLVAAMVVDYRILKTWARPLYVIAVVLLVAVLFLGTEVRGSHAWFNLGFFNFQPSEFAKVVVIVVLAKYFSDNREELSLFKHLVISFAYILLPSVLVLVEPDLGSALLIIGIWVGMVLTVGIKRWHALVFLASGILVALIAWNFLLVDYQKERITNFLAPLENCQSFSGYNVCQSYIAIGSGGMTGRGFAQGTQSQLNFLPEKHTDFIFAVIAEELGFVGSVFLLVVFGAFFLRSFWISQKAQDNFGLFVALGVGVLFVVQTIVNLGANMGVLPVTGVTLPFVSYGGSSMVFSLMLVGVLLSVHLRHKKQRFA
ncbi:MAG: rod shape-determining protein RodA [Patescibacteria group bacterium]|nr:rod shape-determining protein RodA [Patescibacteria group bacterium]